MILKSEKVLINNNFKPASLLVENGIVSTGDKISSFDVCDFNNCIIIPGFVDVHVHLREPGFSYKETIKTGTLAAACGGYTTVCTMPNLNPVPDSIEGLKVQTDIIKNDAVISVCPYGAITKGQQGKQLSLMDELAEHVIAFSDDGHGVQDDEIMKKAMETAKKLNKMIVAHCEENILLKGGYIHDGEYARQHNHKGISSESEWRQVERDLELVRQTGCAYHVCHVSTKETVELVRKAKKQGLDVSCETAPHYLVLNDMCLQEDGRFKMNPPIRSEEDRLALIEGIKDGTIEIIATDHAPHSQEEKSKGLGKSAMGIVGLETSFPVLYTKLVKPGIITIEDLVALMSTNPRKRFGIKGGTTLGKSTDMCVINLDRKEKIMPESFKSKGRATPFEGMEVYGKVVMTVLKGEIVWHENSTEK